MAVAPGQHDLLSTRDIQGMFYEELSLDYGELWISKVAAGPHTSNQAQEKYPWLGMVPSMTERKGANVYSSLAEQSITVVNEEWQTGIKVDRTFARRDKTTQLRVRLGDLASVANYHWQERAVSFVKNGNGSTVHGTCYDGQNFFSASHSEGDSGTQVNLLTSTQVSALNISTATAPTQVEAALALLGVIGYMMAYKDDQGRAINATAKEWTVLVPFNLFGAFQAAAASLSLDSGSGAVSNPFPRDWKINIQMVPGIEGTVGTASAVFYVARTDGRSSALLFQEEVAPTLEILGPGSEYEKEHNEHLYNLWCSRAVAYGHWHHMSHCTLS